MWLVACCAEAAPSASPPLVVDLLRSFADSGNEVLYSTDLVPPTLSAPSDTRAPDLVSKVIEALSIYNLQLKQIGDHKYIVTRETPHRAGLAAILQPRLPTSAAPSPTVEEILVFASHYGYMREADRETNAVDRQAIEQLAGTQNDAFRAVRSVPGAASTYSARPYIRGGTGDDILFRFDGITLARPFHFMEFQSLLGPFIPAAVDRIDIYTGGFPVQFGTRLAGVIDVVPRTVARGYDLHASASHLGLDFSGAGRADRWPMEWLVSLRRSPENTTVLQPLSVNSTEPAYLDTLARFRWSVNPDSILTVGWLLLGDNARADARSFHESATLRSRDMYMWLACDHSPIAGLKSRMSLAYARSDNSHSGSLLLTGIADGSVAETHSSSSLSAHVSWTYARGAAQLWTGGLEFSSDTTTMRYQHNELFTAAVVPSIAPSAQVNVNTQLRLHATTAALFASVRSHWRPIDLEVGARLDIQQYGQFGVRAQAAPRMNLRFNPAPFWHVYASWGEFSQAQRIDEFREEDNQTRPDAASRASHTVVGIARNPNGATRWRLELYHNYWSSVSPYEFNALGLITLLPELQPDRVHIAPLHSSSDGIELSAKRSLGRHVDFWGSYTLSRAMDSLPNGAVPRSWDQPHALTAGLTWNSPQIIASLYLSWHTGWPRTRIAARTDLPSGPSLVLSPVNTSRWDYYFSADAHVSRAIPTRLGEFDVWLDITNLSNRANKCCTRINPLAAPTASPTWSTDSWPGRGVNLGFSWRLQSNH